MLNSKTFIHRWLFIIFLLGFANIPNSFAQGFPQTANSITSSVGPSRSDPEGVAPLAPSTTHLIWKDSRNADRKMVLNAYLYQYDFSFTGGMSDPSLVTTRSAGDYAWGHPGFGYVVSHNNQSNNSPLGKSKVPSVMTTKIFSGGHHAIYHIETLYDRGSGGYNIKVPLVIEWMVATGRDHPVWAVNWQMGNVSNPNNINLDTYRMDVRGPYGSLNFDGASTRAAGDAIGGVAWGDFGYKFVTSGSQLTLNSPWTYNTANTVNFTQAWTANTNAEMGIVQTRTLDKEMGFQDLVMGRHRGNTSTGTFPGKGDCSSWGDSRTFSLPCVNGWPYQLMNYDWSPGTGKTVDEASGTKLIAWGTPYGWLGSSSFYLFDYSATRDGRGDRSFSTFIVLGPKCRYSGGVCNQPGDVANTIKAVEALSAASISNLSSASLVTQIAKGPGATQMKTLSNGYNDTYATYHLNAAGDNFGFTFTPAVGKSVKNPIFVIQNYNNGTIPNIKVAGTPITVNTGDANSGAFVSLNTSNNELWITLNQTLSTATSIQIGSEARHRHFSTD